MKGGVVLRVAVEFCELLERAALLATAIEEEGVRLEHYKKKPAATSAASFAKRLRQKLNDDRREFEQVKVAIARMRADDASLPPVFSRDTLQLAYLRERLAAMHEHAGRLLALASQSKEFLRVKRQSRIGVITNEIERLTGIIRKLETSAGIQG